MTGAGSDTFWLAFENKRAARRVEKPPFAFVRHGPVDRTCAGNDRGPKIVDEVPVPVLGTMSTGPSDIAAPQLVDALVLLPARTGAPSREMATPANP